MLDRKMPPDLLRYPGLEVGRLETRPRFDDGDRTATQLFFPCQKPSVPSLLVEVGGAGGHA